MDVAVIVVGWCSVLVCLVGDSAMLICLYVLTFCTDAGLQSRVCSSECKQGFYEDPCGAAQLDNRSVRGGPAVFARLLAC